MAFCPNCGAPHEPGAKFCAGCGNGLAAPNPAPQNPAPVPQNPAPQAPAPQYQTPQYPQQPPYQVPQYPQQPQVSQYPQQQPAGSNLQKNRSSAKMLSIVAVVLVVVSFALNIVSHMTYAVTFEFPVLSSAKNALSNPIFLRACLISAILPCLAIFATFTGKSKWGNGLLIGTGCFLGIQLLAAVLRLAAVILMRFGLADLSVITQICVHIPGSYILTIFYDLFNAFRYIDRFTFFIVYILDFLHALCLLLPTVFTLLAAGKLKKS